MSVKEGGTFETFRDPNGNVLSSINRDGTVLLQGIDFADGTTQNTAAGGGGAVSSVFGRSGAVVAVSGDYTAAQLGVAALPNGVTATTQAAADNSTKVATTAYVDAAAAPTHQAQVTLTNADILGMNDDVAPVLVVAAISGKCLIPIAVVAKFHFGGTSFFTGVATGDLHVSPGSAFGFPNPLFIGSTQFFVDGSQQNNTVQAFLPSSSNFLVIGNAATGLGSLLVSTSSTLVGGLGANTMTVSIQYLIYDVTTGTFS